MINKEDIVGVLKELYRITGFRVSLHDMNYEEIAAYPEGKLKFCIDVQKTHEELAKCVACDKLACKRANEKKDTFIYKCRHGFTEAVSPLYNFGSLTGYLMMGQVIASDDADGLSEAVRDSGAPTVPTDMISSYIKIMTICARYLTLSNAIPSIRPTLAELARNYIHQNYPKKFTIPDMCDSIGCSKTALLTAFKSKYGTTVNSYITELRLNMAQRLLDYGDRSIGEVARETGFSDQSYFSKVFSAKFGTSPSDYAKSSGKENR
ncbi:MAG: PocR ligand-binding domain-containing protein [Clostridia bacterium]|nr:PocR ligand-binding domain-containing protein [Clostridia bacterium]